MTCQRVNGCRCVFFSLMRRRLPVAVVVAGQSQCRPKYNYIYVYAVTTLMSVNEIHLFKCINKIHRMYTFIYVRMYKVQTAGDA